VNLVAQASFGTHLARACSPLAGEDRQPDGGLLGGVPKAPGGAWVPG